MTREKFKEIDIDFEKRDGLIPVVVQDIESGDILMLAYANKEAINISIETKEATFWSTSRKEIWTKGKTSGDILIIKDIFVDCDQDAVLYKVSVKGNGACHTKNKDGKSRKSCFYRKMDFNKKELIFTEE